MLLLFEKDLDTLERRLFGLPSLKPKEAPAVVAPQAPEPAYEPAPEPAPAPAYEPAPAPEPIPVAAQAPEQIPIPPAVPGSAKEINLAAFFEQADSDSLWPGTVTAILSSKKEDYDPDSHCSESEPKKMLPPADSHTIIMDREA